jgi:hypothetical protein
MERITEKMLNLRVKRLNQITNSPVEPYTKNEEGKYIASIGNFHLSHAYGGVCLHRMHGEGGGITTPIISYHTTKRNLYDRLNAFIDGIQFANEHIQAN